MQRCLFHRTKKYINISIICLLILNIHFSSFSQNIDFVDTLFSKRLNSLNLMLELPYNEIIEQNIRQKIYLEADKTGTVLGIFFHEKNYIDSLLKIASLPSELQYLPLALTQMGVNQNNQIHCAGIWQIPYFVAVSYGLVVNEHIDERYDIRKATPAAIAYLKKLSENYTDLWDIIIAYANSAPALKAAKIRTQPNNDIWNVCSGGNLPDKEIIPDFITWVYLAHFYQSHHIKLTYPVVYNNVKSIYLQKSIPVELFVAELELNKIFFFQCNPVLTGTEIPPYCEVYIPEGKLEVFSLKESTLYAIADSLMTEIKKDTLKQENTNQTVTRTKPVYYTVKSGDVLGKIAQKNNVTITQLKKWNNLKNDNISIGQRLIVWQSSSSTTNQTNISPAKTNTESSVLSKKENFNETIYVVQGGDVLFQIAAKHNVTVCQLKEWNNLKNDNIQVGQKLIVRSTNTSSKPVENASPSASKKTTYTVKSGDTLGKIANTYKVSVNDLKKWNNLKSDRIDIGQKLTIMR